MTGLGEKDKWFKEHPVEVEWFGAKMASRLNRYGPSTIRSIEGTI
ncbi:hypothetical protein ACEQPO_04550 [Bacillus sp. SL00103]